MVQTAKLWPAPVPMWSKVVRNRCKIILITFCYHSILLKVSLKCTPGDKDGPDGQVMAGPGPHMVQGGLKDIQNDPYIFLLPPYLMKICSM